MKPVVVVAEHYNGRILPVTHELMACARVISHRLLSPIVIVIPGTGDPAMAEELSLLGVKVINLVMGNIESYTSEAYKACLHELFTSILPSHVLVANTSTGRDFAPGLGVRLNGCSIAGVNNLVWDDGGFLFSRPVMNGAKNALVRPGKEPCILMVQPGAFCAEKVVSIAGTIVEIKIPFSGQRIESLGIKTINTRGEDLERAKVIVAAGRGIKERENIGIIEKFAALFPRSMVGASRPLIDNGWMEYRFQVGITGATVSPKVYIACGISGSSQHLAGIKGSELIVSINLDPNAAIFNHSDICIVEDIFEFINAFQRIFSSQD